MGIHYQTIDHLHNPYMILKVYVLRRFFFKSSRKCANALFLVISVILLLLLYISALHQHTDDNVPGTNITMRACMSSNFYIQQNIYKEIKFQKLFLFLPIKFIPQWS